MNLTILQHIITTKSRRVQRMSDKSSYRTLLLSKLLGEKPEWPKMACLSGGKSFTVADVCGVVQDEHGEKVQESLKQVHYDCKNNWRI